MKHGWTGGQYSVCRAILGAILFLCLVLRPARGGLPDLLAAFAGEALGVGVLTLALAACLSLAIGWKDRLAALVLCGIGAGLVARNPALGNASLAFCAWLLLAHAASPPAPFGSWAARGRVDPNGAWRLPDALYRASWVVMALGHAYGGYVKLLHPPGGELILALPDGLLAAVAWCSLLLQLAFAPLALVGRLRPWLWAGMAAVHLISMLFVDLVGLGPGMVLLHLFTFDPAWVRADRSDTTETLFYDGGCGLCHRAVRFVLAEDRNGDLRFAPLQGRSFNETIPPQQRQRLPDSLVLRTDDGRLLLRSTAVRHLLRRIGGIWRLVGALGGLLPAPLTDRAYDAVAALRYRWFGRTEQSCPTLPPELRERFDP